MTYTRYEAVLIGVDDDPGDSQDAFEADRCGRLTTTEKINALAKGLAYVWPCDDYVPCDAHVRRAKFRELVAVKYEARRPEMSGSV